MIREKSAGLIVFRRHPQEGVQYFILYHRGNYWNFPKGKMEAGESEMDTAVRETAEEAGLKDLRVVDGFRQPTDFFFKESRGGKTELIKKDLILYLAEAPFSAVPKLSIEHNGYAWFDFAMACKFLKFKRTKEILAEADSLIGKQPADRS